MKSIELSDEQLNNLSVFLQRTELKGKEVPAFVEIVNAINAAKKVEEKVVDSELHS